MSWQWHCTRRASSLGGRNHASIVGAASGRALGTDLAGGDGLRLRPLTRLIAGDERPKQFCSLLGSQSLLERTCRRAALAISPARTMVVLTRAHERYYIPFIANRPPHSVVIQPENRGTAAAILYGTMPHRGHRALGAVAVLPADHYVSDDSMFMGHVAAAFAAVEVRPDLVVLLGITPENAETEYGWIEPGEPIPGTGLLRVARFWEKPAPQLARTLLDRGCVWNSFVVVARVPALLAMIRGIVPDLSRAFAPRPAAAQDCRGAPRRSGALREPGAAEFLRRRAREAPS